MNMNVWSETIFSDDEDSDYDIIASDSDMSMPSLEETIPLEDNEELFVEEATAVQSPTYVSALDFDTVTFGPGIVSHGRNDYSAFSTRQRLTTTQQFARWREMDENYPRLQLRSVQRNILIEIDTQDCIDKMIETLEIDYQNPFAIKIQTLTRAFLARKKVAYLKEISIANDITHSCCVCYNDLHSLNMSVTPCGHYYCSTCFLRWMNQNNTCAMCRKVLYKPNIDINQLDRSTRRSVRYHSRLQRRILDLEMNNMKLKDEQLKIVQSANQYMARQIRMREVLAQTRMAIIEETKKIDSIYCEYIDIIDDVKKSVEIKINLEKKLSKKFDEQIKEFNTFKHNKRKLADKILERTYKNKIRKTDSTLIPFTVRILNDDTDYDSFTSFWDNILEEDEYEIVDEVML